MGRGRTRCEECNRVRRRNFYNNHEFSMNLHQSEPYPHSHLDFSVVAFYDSTEGEICDSTFDLVLDKGCGDGDGLGDGEKILCEDLPINQLERLYHFLDLVLNKTIKEIE